MYNVIVKLFPEGEGLTNWKSIRRAPSPRLTSHLRKHNVTFSLTLVSEHGTPRTLPVYPITITPPIFIDVHNHTTRSNINRFDIQPFNNATMRLHRRHSTSIIHVASWSWRHAMDDFVQVEPGNVVQRTTYETDVAVRYKTGKQNQLSC